MLHVGRAAAWKASWELGIGIRGRGTLKTHRSRPAAL